MKKFHFRLETVHRVRAIQDELARGELVAANYELAKLTSVVDARANRVNTISRLPR